MDEFARCEPGLICQRCSKTFEKGERQAHVIGLGFNADFIQKHLIKDTAITVDHAKLLFGKVENEHAKLA
jgi:hypothetical protein